MSFQLNLVEACSRHEVWRFVYDAKIGSRFLALKDARCVTSSWTRHGFVSIVSDGVGCQMWAETKLASLL